VARGASPTWFLFARVLHPWLIGVAVWPGQA
jgi:hypothetical protein